MTPPNADALNAAALAVHPVAALFPMCTEEELQALAKDIAEHGLIEPIVRRQGVILDGRNRLAGCGLAGVPPEFREWEGEEEDIIPWILSKNVHRRHLTVGQRAFIADELAKLADGHRQVGKFADVPTQAEAASLMNVSERSVRDARVVKESGDEKLIEAVKSGELAVSAAAKTVRGEPEDPVAWGNADKRRAVELALRDPGQACLPDREIGRRLGVTHPFVAKMRRELGIEAPVEGIAPAVETPLPPAEPGPQLDPPAIKSTEEQDHPITCAEVVALAVAQIEDWQKLGHKRAQITVLRDRVEEKVGRKLPNLVWQDAVAEGLEKGTWNHNGLYKEGQLVGEIWLAGTEGEKPDKLPSFSFSSAVYELRQILTASAKAGFERVGIGAVRPGLEVKLGCRIPEDQWVPLLQAGAQRGFWAHDAVISDGEVMRGCIWTLELKQLSPPNKPAKPADDDAGEDAGEDLEEGNDEDDEEEEDDDSDEEPAPPVKAPKAEKPRPPAMPPDSLPAGTGGTSERTWPVGLRFPVFIAGPFDGADRQETARNIERALRLAELAAALGYSPLVPHVLGDQGVYGEADQDTEPEVKAATRKVAMACSVSHAVLVARAGGGLWVLMRDDSSLSPGVVEECNAFDKAYPLKEAPHHLSMRWKDWRKQFEAAGLLALWER